MFGNNQVTSTWGQPQQNQQQPQQGTSTFGQPATNNAFGGGTFGSGGAFGQPQQQQQPQANPMFGGQASTSTATPGNTGFGAFGQNNTATTGTGLFGAPKPTTAGFGAFGGGGGTTGTTTFGGAGAFGGGAGTSTGLFGAQNNNTTGAFGGGGGMFGQAKPATTAFGATPTTTTTANTADGVAPVTTGSSNPVYAVYSEKDPVNSSTTLQYQSISCMPAYRGSSFEELRWQDYQQGRKTAGSFGQSTFGAPATQPATSTGLFGQPAATNPAQPAGNVFGGFGNTANNTAGTSTTGAFGTFGQPAAGTNTTTTGGGLFGGGGAFGQQQQPQPQQQATGFGAFGQPQQQQQQQQQQPQNQPAGTGLFGGGAFGQQANQPKPFGTFGATNTTGTTGGFGTFGQTTQTQPGATGTGLFGQTQPQPQQQQNPGFGTFGQNSQQKPSIFGQQAQPATNAFGGFGNTNQTQTNQAGTQPAGGLFGNTGTTGGGLFGNTQQQPSQQQPATSLFGNQATQQPTTGLFGNTNTTNTGGGLFGNAQPQQNATQPANGGFGLFGQKPPTATPVAVGGLFGGFGQQNTNTTGQTQQQPSGLFGQQPNQTAQPANNTFNLFGKPATAPGVQTSTQPATGGFGGSLFGGGLGTSIGPTSQTAPQQPTLTASLAQPIGANLPIFSILPPGPRAINLDQPKKKSGLFLDVPTRSPVPRLQLGYTPAASKLRGFTSTSTTPGQGFGSSMSLTNGKPGALSLSKAANQKSLLGPDAILNGGGPTPGLGSGGRQSVKKLILDRKVQPSDLFGKNTQPKVTFNPALSIAARELDAAAAAQRLESGSKSAQKGKFSAQASNDSVAKEAEKAPEAAEPKEGEYYVYPKLGELKKRSFGELGATEGLVVGRVGYGEIQFLEPADLTGLRRTTDLMGEVVRFDDKECTVYAELEDADKPQPGSGLNVAARISLVNCWALDKATRKPIKDESHPGAVRHLKRLKNMKGTHFESFDIAEGKWVFTVDHF